MVTNLHRGGFGNMCIFDPAIPLLRIYPEDKPPTIQKYICIRLFIEAFVVIAKY